MLHVASARLRDASYGFGTAGARHRPRLSAAPPGLPALVDLRLGCRGALLPDYYLGGTGRLEQPGPLCPSRAARFGARLGAGSRYLERGAAAGRPAGSAPDLDFCRVGFTGLGRMYLR